MVRWAGAAEPQAAALHGCGRALEWLGCTRSQAQLAARRSAASWLRAEPRGHVCLDVRRAELVLPALAAHTPPPTQPPRHPPRPQDAIDNFAGSVLIVSHDRWFLDRVATHILAFEGDSTVTWHEGSYSDYEAAKKAGGGGINPSRMKFRKLAAV